MKRSNRLTLLIRILGIPFAGMLALFNAKGSPVSTIAAPQSILAQCKESTTHADVESWCFQHALTLRSPLAKNTGLEIVEVPSGLSPEDVMALGERSGLFEYVEPDYPLQAYKIPNDRALRLGQTWGLQNIGQRRGLPDADIDAPEGWDYRTSAADVIVAVIDSGIRYTHEDLKSNLWQNPDEIPDNNRDDDRNGIVDDQFGYNAVRNNGDPWDDDGHGTAVSGVIGAAGNNQIGTTGVAWEVKIMSLKFLDSDGQGLTSDAIDCIDYALFNGANIINASWGGNGRSRSLERAIRRARARDVLFVTAAGNDQANIDRAPDFPASYSLSNIITVGSSNRIDQPSSISNFGMNTVDLFAPGSHIYTCDASTDRSYGFSSGTSLAAPFVTGTLALMIASDPSLSGFELTTHLLESVDSLPSLQGLAVSEGRLNLASALSRLNPAPEFLSPQLKLNRTGLDLTLEFSAASDQAYLLESSNDLENWRAVQRLQTSGNEPLEINLSSEQTQHQFFRARPLN